MGLHCGTTAISRAPTALCGPYSPRRFPRHCRDSREPEKGLPPAHPTISHSTSAFLIGGLDF